MITLWLHALSASCWLCGNTSQTYTLTPCGVRSCRHVASPETQAASASARTSDMAAAPVSGFSKCAIRDAKTRSNSTPTPAPATQQTARRWRVAADQSRPHRLSRSDRLAQRVGNACRDQPVAVANFPGILLSVWRCGVNADHHASSSSVKSI